MLTVAFLFVKLSYFLIMYFEHFFVILMSNPFSGMCPFSANNSITCLCPWNGTCCAASHRRRRCRPVCRADRKVPDEARGRSASGAWSCRSRSERIRPSRTGLKQKMVNSKLNAKRSLLWTSYVATPSQLHWDLKTWVAKWAGNGVSNWTLLMPKKNCGSIKKYKNKRT